MSDGKKKLSFLTVISTIICVVFVCEAAAPGELLAHAVDDAVPDWVNLAGTVTVRAMGIGDVAGVSQLRVDDQAWATMSPVVSHPSLALVSTEFSPLLDERSDDHAD